MNEAEEKIDLILWTGHLLLQSGANSNRIERNMRRAAHMLGIRQSDMHLHLNLRTIMMSINIEGKSYTRFRKVKQHGVNMTTISATSRAIWLGIKENFSPAQYRKELERVAAIAAPYPRLLVVTGIGVACASFCALLGGMWFDLICAGLAASIGVYCRQTMHHRHYNNYMNVVICAFVTTMIAGLCTKLPELLQLVSINPKPNIAIAASVLYLIPGVPLVNSIDDLIDGFTIMGVGRAVVALIFVLSITLGMIFAISLLNVKLI